MQGTGRQPKTAVPANRTPAGSSGNGGNTSENFVKDRRWARIFLPSLTHVLYTSREPFEHFRSDSPEFLATVQAAFNASFVNVDVTLSFNDTVTITVCQISIPYVLTLTFPRPTIASSPESRYWQAMFLNSSRTFSKDPNSPTSQQKFVNMFDGP